MSDGMAEAPPEAAEGPVILAIDLGTSGPKVALFTAQGQAIDSASSPTVLRLLPGGGAEQDPEDWWRAICAASRALFARHPALARRVRAVSCTAQWSGTVPVDETGAPVHPAIIWMDARGQAEVRALVGGAVRVSGYDPLKLWRWVSLTGGAPGRSGKDPVAHILWLRQARPEAYQRACCFLEPKDWINARLTGRLAASYDSIALHWVTDNRDLSAVAYDPRLLARVGLGAAQLPELKPATAVLGPILGGAADALGLSPGGEPPVVVMGTPDVHSAALGSGAVLDYAPHLYIGTSSWITCHVPWKKTDLLRNIASLPSALPGRYLAANAQETAGACLNHLLDRVVYAEDELALGARPADAFERLERAAASAPAGSERVLFLPWLYGERTPVDDAALRGGFFNVSLSTTRAHLVRAVLEGVAYNGRWLLGEVERFCGRPLGPVTFVGGGARLSLWGQIHADVLGRPIRQVEAPVLANARGAAFLAGLALGAISVEEIAAQVPIARTFEPVAAHRARYDELYGCYREFHRRNRGLFARMQRGGDA